MTPHSTLAPPPQDNRRKATAVGAGVGGRRAPHILRRPRPDKPRLRAGTSALVAVRVVLLLGGTPLRTAEDGWSALRIVRVEAVV